MHLVAVSQAIDVVQDNDTGAAETVCSSCNERIRLSSLSSHERRVLYLGVLKLAALNSPREVVLLSKFKDFVSRSFREGNPYTAIIDAPNVAYTRQNHLDGHFSFLQIELIRQELVRRGERPLIILPRAYHFNNTRIPNRSKGSSGGFARHVQSYWNETFPFQDLTTHEVSLMKMWQKENCLYVCNLYSFDYHYALMATVASQPAPKRPVFVVTNDLLRDHRLALLEPRVFQKWKNVSLVRFMFEFPVPASATKDPEQFFAKGGKLPRFWVDHSPDCSVEIQQSIKSNLTGEMQRESMTWHIPILPDAVDWLCCRLSTYETVTNNKQFVA